MARRVLVTGAASGLGAALVRRLSSAGDHVLATDLAEDLPGSGAEYLPLDVRRDDEWQRARRWCEQRWGGLDLLVNNAGVASGGRIGVFGLEEWDRVLDVNLAGVVRGCHTFAPVMQRQRRGHIVNVASAAGLVHPPGMSAYNTAKAGVVALSETLRHELAPHGVGVSVVCPSFFRSGLSASLAGADPEVEARARALLDGATMDVATVADAVLEGVDRGRFMIVPDRSSRLAWAVKRFLRPAYERSMRRIGRDLYTRTRKV